MKKKKNNLLPIQWENVVWGLPPQRFDALVEQFEKNALAYWADSEDETDEEPTEYELIEYQGSRFALLKVEGVMVKTADYWDRKYGGMYGTSDLFAILDKIEKDDRAQGLLVIVDSPGGVVDGIEALAKRIEVFKKENVCLVRGTCASAAYWFASTFKRIIASSNTDEIGSIGVLIRHTDRSKQLANEGIKVTYITSDDSPEKAGLRSELPLTDKAIETVKTDLLNPIYQEFVETILAHRNVSEEALNGKVFLAKQALALGLIDEIGNEETAFKFLSKKISKKNQTQMKKEEVPAAQTSTTAGQTTPDNPPVVPTAQTDLTQVLLAQMMEKMNQIEAKVGALGTENQELKTQNANLKQQVETTTAAKAEAERKLEETPVDKVQVPVGKDKTHAFSRRLVAEKPPKDDFEAIQNIIAMGIEEEGTGFQAYVDEFAEHSWNKEKSVKFS